MKQTNWYKDAVIYQIYPRSFCDSNGDGIGDIPGIISKLDYLKELGVNCVWLSPVYDSPQKDMGYDIANYKDIYPPFGTLDDFKRMLDEMHKRGIRLIMDLVVNHTSDQHPWFQSAISDKNSPYRDYYVFKKGKKNGKKPPNNWSGFFAEGAWEKEPNFDEYYLHLFAKEQPDLNWENPKVKEEVKDILRYWLDMGVDGFRCDVITLISKDQRYKDDLPKIALSGGKYYICGPKLHTYLHELYTDVLSNYDCMTVGETVLANLKQTQDLVSPEREELSMAFNFKHTDVDNFFGIKYLYRKFSLRRFKKTLFYYQKNLHNKGWNSLFIENHDQRRSVGRFGTLEDEEYRTLSSEALFASYFLLEGTPFIYEGQEIGTRNNNFTIDEHLDVEIHNMYKMCESNALVRLLAKKHLEDTSRDHPRVPMSWDDSETAGFTTGKPWMKVNDYKDIINVKKALEDKNSLWYFYQKLIAYRKGNEVIRNGETVPLYANSKKLFAYKRVLANKEIVIFASFSKKDISVKKIKDYKESELVINNYEGYEDGKLKSFQVLIFERNI